MPRADSRHRCGPGCHPVSPKPGQPGRPGGTLRIPGKSPLVMCPDYPVRGWKSGHGTGTTATQRGGSMPWRLAEPHRLQRQNPWVARGGFADVSAHPRHSYEPLTGPSAVDQIEAFPGEQGVGVLLLPFGPMLTWRSGDIAGAAKKLAPAALLAFVTLAATLALAEGRVYPAIGLAIGLIAAGATSASGSCSGSPELRPSSCPPCSTTSPPR